MDMQLEKSFLWFDEPELDLSLVDYCCHLDQTSKLESRLLLFLPNLKALKSLTGLSKTRQYKSRRSDKRLCKAQDSRRGMVPLPQVPTLPSLLHATTISTISREDMAVQSIELSDFHPNNYPPPESLTLPTKTRLSHAAEHYLDPETRLKLRTYLATPSRFEEALRYGFPSSRSSSDSAYIITHQQLITSNEDFIEQRVRPEFHGKDLVGLGNLQPASSCHMDFSASPTTPATAVSTTHKPKGSNRPPNWNDSKVDYPQQLSENIASGREMTLRMTLTRPDLRDLHLDHAMPHSNSISRSPNLHRKSGRRVANYATSDLDSWRPENVRPNGVSWGLRKRKEGSLSKIFSTSW